MGENLMRKIKQKDGERHPTTAGLLDHGEVKPIVLAVGSHYASECRRRVYAGSHCVVPATSERLVSSRLDPARIYPLVFLGEALGARRLCFGVNLLVNPIGTAGVLLLDGLSQPVTSLFALPQGRNYRQRHHECRPHEKQ